ncbi:hypothetical protein ABIA85_009903, partial [Bradyrhizobium sp. LA6.10]
FYAACYGYSVATYRNHTLRKTVLRDVLHERLFKPRRVPQAPRVRDVDD